MVVDHERVCQCDGFDMLVTTMQTSPVPSPPNGLAPPAHPRDDPERPLRGADDQDGRGDGGPLRLLAVELLPLVSDPGVVPRVRHCHPPVPGEPLLLPGRVQAALRPERLPVGVATVLLLMALLLTARQVLSAGKLGI